MDRTMQRWKLPFTVVAVAAALLSRSEARIIPLASTTTARSPYAAAGRASQSESSEGAASSETKRNGPTSSLRRPKLWGRSNKKKAEPKTVGDGDATKNADAERTKDANDEKTEDAADRSETAEGGTKNDEASSSSPSDSTVSDENAKPKPDAKEETPQSAEDGNTGTAHPEAQPANQTRSGLLYLTPPAGPMAPQYARPMPYPFSPQQQPPPPRPRSSSLLSSLLAALLPGPPQMPPPSPYGPPPPPGPGGPGGPGGAVAALVLRLALLSLGSVALDALGLGGGAAFLPAPAQHYSFERVNDRYRRDGAALRQALASPPPGVPARRWRRAHGRRQREAARALATGDGAPTEHGAPAAPSLGNGALYNRTVVVLDVKPDARVGGGMAEHLRDSVSFLIEQHRDHVGRRARDAGAGARRRPSLAGAAARGCEGARPALGAELEVVLLLNSPGGTVHDYGLASSHLSRLRDEPQITLSVCVDRVAASGGYMMACQATPGHLFAAPFAMVGSIGVIMETVNFNEVLKRYGVKPLVITAGTNKAPLKTFGEVTPEELQMAQDDADGIHAAFQQWVAEARPHVVASKAWTEKVCTGAVFLGREAQDLGLVDRVLTSDEYIATRIAAGDRVLRLLPYRGPQFGGLRLSPWDLLTSGLNAEGRARRARDTLGGWGRAALRRVAPLLRVGATVGVLNRLASLQRQGPDYCWAA